MESTKVQLLLKELDLIDNTISRLDSQIQITKNICITLWTAWLGWFMTKQIDPENCKNYGLPILMSVIFPFISWMVDSCYRRALLSAGKRRGLISLYLNNEMNDNLKKHIKFPLLDPVGWTYDYNKINELIDPLKLSEEGKRLFGEQNPFFYKEAKLFYPALILLSLFFGIWLLIYGSFYSLL